MLAEALVCGIREIAPLQHEQLPRVFHGQGLQQDGIEHAEDCGVGADAQRERENGSCGEDRAPAEDSQRVSHVLEEEIDERQTALIAISLLHRLHSTERSPRQVPRLIRMHPSRTVLGGGELEMHLDFFVQLPIEPTGAAEERPEARQPHPHDKSSMNRVTMPAARAQLAVSACSCVLPLRVIA